MVHLYHLVPRNFRGEVLQPLNRLKETFPDLYEAHAQKYEGREALLQWRIPHLHCLWNDVLHFSPIHPTQIRDALRAAGYDWKPRRWFAVEPAACGFDEQNTVIYYSRPRALGDFTKRDDDFAPYDPQLLPALVTLPKETAAYYGEAVARDEPPFAFRFIPHILHRGTIRRDELAIVEV